MRRALAAAGNVILSALIVGTLGAGFVALCGWPAALFLLIGSAP